MATVVGGDPTVSAAPTVATPARATRGRGRRQSAVFGLRQEIPPRLRLALTLAGVASVVALWGLASTVWSTGQSFSVPTIAATWDALVEMQRDGTLWVDFRASLERVVIGYGLALLIGVAIGVLMGSFVSATTFLEPQVGFLRYVPASALTPLFLIWMGIDETPKIALIVVGTVFYVILMTADVVRAVPMPLINAAYTVGAGRLTVIRRVIMPHSWPGIIDVARINLAAAWLMLVVAELLAAQEGLAFRIIRAQRFRRIDRMFALLLIFGLLGLLSDMLLRWLRRRSSPWADS
ncbi:MAG: ABC transporter permease [Actinomycetota bacterium]